MLNYIRMHGAPNSQIILKEQRPSSHPFHLLPIMNEKHKKRERGRKREREGEKTEREKMNEPGKSLHVVT